MTITQERREFARMSAQHTVNNVYGETSSPQEKQANYVFQLCKSILRMEAILKEMNGRQKGR